LKPTRYAAAQGDYCDGGQDDGSTDRQRPRGAPEGGAVDDMRWVTGRLRSRLELLASWVIASSVPPAWARSRPPWRIGSAIDTPRSVSFLLTIRPSTIAKSSSLAVASGESGTLFAKRNSSLRISSDVVAIACDNRFIGIARLYHRCHPARHHDDQSRPRRLHNHLKELAENESQKLTLATGL